MARYFQLSSKEDNSNSNEGNMDPPSNNSNGNMDPSNSNGNVDHHYDVDQLDLGNVDATRSVIIEQSRILAQLR